MAIDATQRQELTNAVGIALVDAAPEGWRRIDLMCLANIDVHDLSLTVLLADGSNPAVLIPDEVRQSLLRLREGMHEPDKGTWFSSRVIIDAPGTIYVKYNYDWDPLWNPSIATEGWARDLEAFPRDEAHIPDWLNEKLAEAGAAEEDR
ncbi:hypothetical protein ED92_20180 [Amycolatopsis sp. MJM2582]|uniref:hypothetical protein n=1 Tax=Amycolatopsis TaxID=1813 RepID=UPI00050677C1|nr:MULTISPECIES: hypothetical protein [unclassified Amycolatopsis]KFZ79700.1 hypothetical protein ED92_20180 [Amycolatopsis sp. MJM2582]RSN47979.1 hypothetical protein DMC64_12220 [Amycolatopsis sp. WAC 04197]